MYDITIIGAGIIGCLLSHSLSKYDLKVLVLEKESDVAEGASGANSAMIHSGHDPKDGTLKCHYNLLGNRMYPELCKELNVSYDPIGAYVAAAGKEEEEILEKLINQCKKRQIPYAVLNREEALKEEQNLSDAVTKVLSLPTTGIVTPWEVCIAAMEEAMLNGVELKLNHEVRSIRKESDYYVIDDQIQSKVLVNCSGAHCEDITNMLRVSPYKVETRKGEYFVLDHLNGSFVKHVIYPVPTAKGKGVLAVPTVHGNVMLGPDSEYCEDIDDDATGEGLDFIRKQINKTVKNIPFHKIIHTFAGLRPHIDLNDFYIQEDDQIKSFIHIAGIESPGLSAAPAIVKDVVQLMILPKFPSCAKKKEYTKRKPFIHFNTLSEEEKNRMIKDNPDYGKLVCRCEQISEAEIRDVINRKCGAKTIKGVKMRCRPGMGRCQGSFCEPDVFRILKEELHVSEKEIKLDRPGSNICVSQAKEDL